MKVALEQAIEEAREMRREQASRIVVPDVGGGGRRPRPGGGRRQDQVSLTSLCGRLPRGLLARQLLEIAYIGAQRTRVGLLVGIAMLAFLGGPVLILLRSFALRPLAGTLRVELWGAGLRALSGLGLLAAARGLGAPGVSCVVRSVMVCPRSVRTNGAGCREFRPAIGSLAVRRASGANVEQRAHHLVGGLHHLRRSLRIEQLLPRVDQRPAAARSRCVTDADATVAASR